MSLYRFELITPFHALMRYQGRNSGPSTIIRALQLEAAPVTKSREAALSPHNGREHRTMETEETPKAHAQ